MMDKLIATIRKNALDEIRISLCQFQGWQLIDIRIFTELENSSERVATKRGVSLKVEMLPELVSAIQAAERALREDHAETCAPR